MSNGQYPGAPAAKPGLPGWAKIAIGCGCLLLIVGALLVFGVVGAGYWGFKKAEEAVNDPSKLVEWVVAANPDLEMVENNKEAGTFSVRDVKTGEVTTFNYSDFKDGNFSIEGKDGQKVNIGASQEPGGGLKISGPDGQEVNIGGGAAVDVPSWVALYPSATETTVGFRIATGEEVNGLVTQTTTDDVATVKKYYEDYFAREGYKITGTFSTDTADQKGLMMNAEKGTTTLGIVLGKSAGSDTTSVNVTYKGPK